MIVCVCNRVSDRDIVRHVQAGMDFSDLQLELGVATVCGRCESCAREVVEGCCSRAPAPRMPAASRSEPVWFARMASA